MKCSFCGREAAYNERASGVLRCDRCLKENVEKKFRRAVTKNKMIAPGETIAVAVSGGKDSTTLLHLVTNYCRDHDCGVFAITVDEGIKGYRDDSIPIARENAERLGVEHVTVSFKEEFGHSLDEILEKTSEGDASRVACTYCGVLRRSLLNRKARELGASKIATGHNLDDEAQAIMLNYVRADLSRLHRLGPAYPPRDGFVPRVKPLYKIPEKEIALYALLNNIEVHAATCPYAEGIHTEIREFINKLETNHPNTKTMILTLFEQLKPKIIEATPKFEPRECEKCGEPSAGSKCKACELLAKIE